MLRFDNTTYLQLLFEFISSVRLSNSLWGSDVWLFFEFINILSILLYNSTEFIIFLYTFLVISFSQYQEYMVCLSLFSTFSDVSLAFTCASTIGNLWSICLVVYILSPLRFCFLLKLMTFKNTDYFLGLPFSGISLILIVA